MNPVVETPVPLVVTVVPMPSTMPQPVKAWSAIVVTSLRRVETGTVEGRVRDDLVDFLTTEFVVYVVPSVPSGLTAGMTVTVSTLTKLTATSSVFPRASQTK